MKTEYRFAETLKTMMAEMPLDMISVTLLAKKCKVKRQTFYYHFHDVYDLLTLVFLNEKIEGIENVTDFKGLIKCIYDYYYKNSAFIEATINSAGKELVQEFINNVCYQKLNKMINAIHESKNITANDRKLIARFYSLGISNSVGYYLTAYRSKTYNGMLNCFSFLTDNFLLEAINNVNAKKGKKA